MALSGDIRIDQDGLVPTAFSLGPSGAVGFGVAVLDATGSPLAGFDASRPATSALTVFTYVTGSVVIAPANPTRRGITLFNASAKPVNVALAATASTGSFSFQIPTNGSWESELNGYTGVISAIWTASAPTGAALHVTELST